MKPSKDAVTNIKIEELCLDSVRYRFDVYVGGEVDINNEYVDY